ncbi:hypothetical protein CpB0293 [Chlamydia pneumoniae TW-183]|uniref:Uncharacterized protein n=2 Tax=Chlamydia pneumoniae TaxID=83558 RepID=Q9Z8Q3_CHLPN|nr:hypothetical protein [Chlamydia pneumoniae]AAP98226.1 hypothetical protein CpB0293 [Chlamydia pneumoniae TW-183]AAD18434.1 hypothetical protein CPn_0285 [Chlamydia pneumoniae CWL029]AAF38307.1 hypothetical protein CP_0473 [Chlamydia pneumoniae AR39]CRI32786.1 Uncharacterized protein BN1224_Wien1_A_02930 [Chlamydia pneumoniae]CRI36776.1 Uncharacterized protein BN1224_CV14_A_02950 [Chlamydia pneumoniae]
MFNLFFFTANKETTASHELIYRKNQSFSLSPVTILCLLAISVLLLLGVVFALVGCHVLAAPLGLLVWGCAASVCSMMAIVSLMCLYKGGKPLIEPSNEEKIDPTKDLEIKDPESLKPVPVEGQSLPKERKTVSFKAKIPSIVEDDFKPYVIQSTFYHQNKVYSKPIAERMQSLEKEITTLIVDFPRALEESSKSSGSLLRGVISEIKNLFLPRFLSRKVKYSLTACLRRLGSIVEEYASSDLLILLLTKPEPLNMVTQQLIAHLNSLKTEKRKLTPHMQKLVLSINFWFYGWSLEEKCIEKIVAYDPNLLTDELKAHLEAGNIVQFLLSFQSSEMQREFRALFPSDAQELPSAKDGSNYVPAINSSEYMYDFKDLSVLKKSLSERLAFCEKIPSPSSWNFTSSVASHYKDFSLLFTFFSNQQSVILQNPFLLIELLHENPKCQTFLKGLLEKAMPMSNWAALFRPMLMGMLCSGIARKKELKIIAEHLGVPFKEITQAIASGKILDLLLQHLFDF